MRGDVRIAGVWAETGCEEAVVRQLLGFVTH